MAAPQAIGRLQKGFDSRPEPKEAPKTKFRRKKLTDAEANELALKERREAAVLARKPKLPGLRSIYNTKVSARQGMEGCTYSVSASCRELFLTVS